MLSKIKLVTKYADVLKMSPVPPAKPGKRKEPPSTNTPGTGTGTNRAAKRVKTSSARTILAQTSDKALNQHGDLDVSAFVKAREFEIKAMEASMGSSRKALSARAFQQIPKDLRRRTASHNVKRVPKRLRARAAKEVRGKSSWLRFSLDLADGEADIVLHG